MKAKRDNIVCKDRNKLESDLRFPLLQKPYVVTTFHPVTLEPGSAEAQLATIASGRKHAELPAGEGGYPPCLEAGLLTGFSEKSCCCQESLWGWEYVGTHFGND